MKLPRFTAESSLYRATNLYQMVGEVSENKGGLYPAQDLEMLNPIDSMTGEIPEIIGRIPCGIVCTPPICRTICLVPPFGDSCSNFCIPGRCYPVFC